MPKTTELLFNPSELLARVDNDTALFRELLLLFKEECPGLIRFLESAVANEEMKAVETTSHALKGMLANLSAAPAAAAALRLEQIGRERKHSQLGQGLAALKAAVAALLPEVDTYLINDFRNSQQTSEN